MRLSVIDIGTNTILLLIADVDTSGTVRPVEHGHVIARLGKGVDAQRMIRQETILGIMKTLEEYVNISREHHVDRIIACGTSALRDARNRLDFVETVRKKLGISVSILSGDEEAELTYQGAVAEFLPGNEGRQYAVLDIGGGSTELTIGQGLQVHAKQSLDIGSVRLTERVLKTMPPSPTVLEEARSFVNSEIRSFPRLGSRMTMIGVAGTLTTLAAIDLRLPAYDPLKVSGHVLLLETVESLFHQLKTLSAAEVAAMPQILRGRADILLAGILILMETMKHLGAKEITASDRGLRYGIAMKEAKRGEFQR